MQYRRLGKSSLRVSVIGLGALHFGTFLDRNESERLIHKAIDEGINFIDTAQLYGKGNSESIIGGAIKNPREKIIITTKAGLEPITRPDGTFGNKVAKLTREYIRKSVHKSLRALNTEYIDLFQLHAFDNTTPPGQTLMALDDLIGEGKIRYIGCSNFNENEFEESMKATQQNETESFVASQCQFSMIERRAEKDLLPVCMKYNVSSIINRGLSKGILTGKYKLGASMPAASRGALSKRVRTELSDEIIALVSELERFSLEGGHSITELALSWLMSKPGVGSILVGTRNIEQLAGCLKSVEWLLSEDELCAVDKIIANHGLTSRVAGLPETFLEK